MPSCRYERCNVQIRYRPKGQGWIASTGIVPKKTLKLRFVPVNNPLWKKFAILFRQNSWQQRFMFCVQISRKSAVRKWVKGCVVLVTIRKFAKCSFSPSFCARLAEGANSVHGNVPPVMTSPCKISSQSVPVCRSYYFRENDFVQPQ